MKLNLLPAYVTKGSQSKVMILIASLISILSILGCVFMIFTSQGKLADEKAKYEELKPQADAVVARAQQAETIAAGAASVTRNVELAKAISLQNRKYTTFYREVFPYVPGFFRPNQISVSPVAPNSCLLSMTGTIQTYQQYADLMLALMRIPGARQVARGGYNLVDRNVRSLDEVDQVGTPTLPTENRLPQKDPLALIAELEARAATDVTGFQNVGNYGGEVGVRTAMPKWSDITVTVLLEDPAAPAAPAAPGQPVVPTPAPRAPAGAPGIKRLSNYNFQTPNPRATLSTAIAGGAAPAEPSAAGLGSPGSAPGGPPPGVSRGPGRGRAEDE